MGRKPNPIILEYFTRGAKLEDSSNRYQHTCKLCGEEFPKGRIDSLVAHLTKKCTSISLPERTKIVLRLHDLGENDEESSHPRNTTLQQGRNVELPYSPTRSHNFNGLNVLAEASRRVGANDPGKGGRNTSTGRGARTDLPVDPALVLDDPPTTFPHVLNQGFELRQDVGTSMPGLGSMFTYLPVQQTQNQDSETTFSDFNLVSSTAPGQVPTQLSSIAASANETLANNSIPEDTTTQLGGNDLIASTLFDSLNDHKSHEHQDSSTSEQVDGDTSMVQTNLPIALHEGLQEISSAIINPSGLPRPIAINPQSQPAHFVAESGTASRSLKPKVRARFTADRRKEVQQVRKQGACIRCRMLKKPCSNGTPCTTCQGVESARLWKQGCIRTRITEEFTLYSAGLHSTLAFHDVNNAKSRLGFQVGAGTLEVSIFDSASPSITFPALKSTSTGALATGEAKDVFILNSENENITAKIREYTHNTMEKVAATETFHFLQNTVLFALKQPREKDSALLIQACELWAATTILADKGFTWRIIATSEPQGDPEHLSEELHPYSCALINSQLRSAIEKHASVLSKNIMNDIERRLLQRQHCGRFETFLTVLIFLSSAERMCWLFLTWDEEKNDDDVHCRWPLDKQPRPYAEQGERIADILNMLLRMRSLAPKCRPRRDGGILEAVEDEDGLAAQWFRQIRITQTFLEDKETARFDVMNFRSLDGTQFARILQSQISNTT